MSIWLDAANARAVRGLQQLDEVPQLQLEIAEQVPSMREEGHTMELYLLPHDTTGELE